MTISTKTILSKNNEQIAAENFQLTSLDQQTVSLSNYRGKTVIVNFWASWCPPCKAEMPHMQSFYEKNKQQNIEILAVNVTKIDSGEKEIKQFVEKYGLTFPILLDEQGTVSSMYGAKSLPTTYIIDENGFIKQKIVGPMNEEMLENLVK